jgi:4-diphosphocytidyl-2-C-methyl-D-erythritol kinase
MRMLAPAKINLGLEILGRRPDGYHELRTIFCAVSLFDRVEIEPAARSSFYCDSADSIEQNLAEVALRKARNLCPSLPDVRLSITKRIPTAAGLGGASSDAANTLIGLNRLSGERLSRVQLADLALRCGSDVPFFLNSGISLGRARGEDLSALPVRSPIHAVIVSPHVTIPDKTRTMYGQISPDSWTGGEQVEALAEHLAGGGSLQPSVPLPNAFRQPLYDLFPEVHSLANRIEEKVGRAVQVSGAGPSVFVICTDISDALRIRHELGTMIDLTSASVHRVRSVSTVLISEGPDV